MKELAVMLAERTGLSRLRRVIKLIESAHRQPIEKAARGVQWDAQAAVIVMRNKFAFAAPISPGEDAASCPAASRGAIDPRHSVLMTGVGRLGDVPELGEVP